MLVLFEYVSLFLFADIGGASTLGQPQHPHKQTKTPEVFCAMLRPPLHGSVFCRLQGFSLPCHQELPAGTLASYRCEEYYKAEPASVAECLENGTWSSPATVCRPDCGKRCSFVSLIVNGVAITPGAFPWQAAIYNYLDNKYEFWCGGSLISEYSVISAAHCAWKVPPKNLVAAFGKFLRDFKAEEYGVQRIRVARVEMLRSYQDVGGNYNGDLAVIFLEKAVKFNEIVRPVCIDWSQEHMEDHLADGNVGIVLGWGLTENNTFSEALRAIRLPVKSDENCISQQHKDFRKFLTYTSFCAGFRNGSGVCNGDSGGGLAFVDKESETWYLQGVVSVSPRRKGTSFCDPNYYTVFTKVTVFVKWLKKMRDMEEELISSQVILSSGPDPFPPVSEITVDMNPKLDILLDRELQEIEHHKNVID